MKGVINMSALFCTNCGKNDLYLSKWHDGLDEHSSQGKGSGFNITVNLTCSHCGKTYVLGRIKEFGDFVLDVDSAHFAYETSGNAEDFCYHAPRR